MSQWCPLQAALFKILSGASALVAQWQEIYLPLQEILVWSLVQKIPRAMEQLSPYATTTEPVLRSLGAVTPEPTCCNDWGLCTPELICSTAKEAATVTSLRTAARRPPPLTATREKAVQQRGPSTAKDKDTPLAPSLNSGAPLFNSICIFSHHLLTWDLIYFFMFAIHCLSCPTRMSAPWRQRIIFSVMFSVPSRYQYPLHNGFLIHIF